MDDRDEALMDSRSAQGYRRATTGLLANSAGILVGLAAVVALLGVTASAQRGFRWEPNLDYDGRFTFARIRYTVYGRSGWEFDYPTMERNLMTMMRATTELDAHDRGSNIHTFDDPELFRYPIAYLSEPGYWLPSESEAVGLRTWLAKGGFLIVDDFMLREWANFERSIHLALPGARIVPLEASHPVFDSFFRIDSLGMVYPHNAWLKSEFLGIFEDNDPSRRLMVVINYNNDIGDYMEWSADNLWPVNITNEAYKFAINYIIYGMTH
ncbi:MAG: DUF4159 domain-containing protein [Gemmatimonadota bacterium]